MSYDAEKTQKGIPNCMVQQFEDQDFYGRLFDIFLSNSDFLSDGTARMINNAALR